MSMLMNSLESFKDVYKGKVFAFLPVLNDYKVPQYAIGVAILGEAGYIPLSPKYGTADSYAELDEKLRPANEALGWNADTVLAIVADTMKRSEHRRNMEAGLTTVRFTLEELKWMKDCLTQGGDIVLSEQAVEYQTILDRVSDEIDNMESGLYG